jgi:hypothetical protein
MHLLEVLGEEILAHLLHMLPQGASLALQWSVPLAGR